MVDTNRSAADALRSAGRVLVVRTDDLGDNVLGSAFPGALARSIPGRCGLIGPTAALDVIPTDDLDFVAGVDCRPRDGRDVISAARRLAKAMGTFRPDVVVLPRFDFEREALGLALAAVRPGTTVTWVRSATPKRQRRNWWLRAFRGPRLDPSGAGVHELDRLRAFARLTGTNDTVLAPRLSDRVLNAPLPSPLEAAPDGLVALGIGAAQGRRLWPAERFGELATSLVRAGYRPVLLGSPGERPQSDRLRAALPSGVEIVDLVGRLALPATAKVISAASLYVGNDSGLGHIAAAAGIPTVTISCHPIGADRHHVNAPERYGPRVDGGVVVRPRHPATPACAGGCQALDSPCCVSGVPVQGVSDRAFELLSRDRVGQS